jgi:hypothetical protein
VPRGIGHRARHLTGKGSGIAMCPAAPDPPPGAGGLWCRHVTPGLPPGREGLQCHHMSYGSRSASRCGRALASPRATEPATQQGRALVLPRVPWLQTRLPVWEGSGVVTCPVPPGPPPRREGLRCRHMSYSSRPSSWCGRALTSPRAPWLSAFEARPCVPKAPNIRLIMASPGTQSRQHIKCVQDMPYATYD